MKEERTSTPGVRELTYFLSRTPLAKDLGEWQYNPVIDSWVHPKGAKLKVACEAAESIATCRFSGGLTVQQVRDFVEANLEVSRP